MVSSQDQQRGCCQSAFNRSICQPDGARVQESPVAIDQFEHDSHIGRYTLRPDLFAVAAYIDVDNPEGGRTAAERLAAAGFGCEAWLTSSLALTK